MTTGIRPNKTVKEPNRDLPENIFKHGKQSREQRQPKLGQFCRNSTVIDAVDVNLNTNLKKPIGVMQQICGNIISISPLPLGPGNLI